MARAWSALVGGTSVVIGFSGWLLAFAGAAEPPSSQFVSNGGFEQGLQAWRATGDVRLETNRPLAGKISVRLGPGPGSLTQRFQIGSGNPLTFSALVETEKTNGWTVALRFLDHDGHEVLGVSTSDGLERDKRDARQFRHYMQAHPLTESIEIDIAKDPSPGTLLVDDVRLDMPDENAANLPPACDLDEAMQPFWRGRRVSHEAVLMVSHDGEPAAGRLLFQPTRILSVQDYGLVTNYLPATDYILHGRTLICPASSRMSQVRAEDLPKGELAWPTVGGQQVMVSYEHDDRWDHPAPEFAGDGLPVVLGKLKSRAPITVVAYGDSITHGLGESRLSRIRPFLPPWPELVVGQLKRIYQDDAIRLYNSAQSGADSTWGARYAQSMVASLHPDLVIVAFGQNDFWGIPARVFADHIAQIIQTVRKENARAEFLLVSPLRFDPAYSTNAQYWQLVGEYGAGLKALTGPGVQFIDMTKLSEWVYAAKRAKDCMNDPLHPNDYFARWYAQSLVAALSPESEPPEPPSAQPAHLKPRQTADSR
ncbi:MAG TPA: SGNH/GDSL hydrolase family protein [Verrucomicrobiae bacterium]|nr:SGNH/GDSL hydrolase family protein [Verrucomicrobiae bacterium]